MDSKRRRDSLLFGTLLLLTLTRPAHAYVDFGTGSMIMQMSVAAFLGFVYVMKRFWASIANAFLAVRQRLFGRRGSTEKENSGM